MNFLFLYLAIGAPLAIIIAIFDVFDDPPKEEEMGPIELLIGQITLWAVWPITLFLIFKAIKDKKP